MVYEWKAISRIKADAQSAGEVCEQLATTIGLTAENLLEVSRDENAPLHNEFEWNDTIAAERYRVDQARYIIRMLCVKPEQEETATTRAFFTLSGAKYEPVSVIMQNVDKTAALMERALSELTAFQRKYSTLKQLEPVFNAIRDVTDANL